MDLEIWQSWGRDLVGLNIGMDCRFGWDWFNNWLGWRCNCVGHLVVLDILFGFTFGWIRDLVGLMIWLGGVGFLVG